MISKAGNLEGKRILEPSAGLGRIYSGIKENNGEDITLIEQDASLCSELYKMTEADKETKLLQGDFLSKDLDGFDIIIMNPPFKMGTDIKHINHALRMLNKGGLLIALCYDGVKQNKQLKPISDTWEALPENSFKDSGTSANINIITITG